VNDDIAVVVPTVGRASLDVLLDALDEQGVPRSALHVVHDVDGRGPAATRNRGWRDADATWIAFLDDDVVPSPGWYEQLRRDLICMPDDVAGVQGRLTVPLPVDRAPTDWERNVAGLARARWATADMAYRRDVLAEVGGFDERFPRAYREDADLGLRVVARGYRIVRGARHVSHPVRPAPWHVSITKQAGNADDALMRRLHGPGWRARAGVPRGARRRHVASTLALVTAAVLAPVRPRAARVAAAGWIASTARFAWRRIAPGPRTPSEIATMVATSAVVPLAATTWWVIGTVTSARSRPG